MDETVKLKLHISRDVHSEFMRKVIGKNHYEMVFGETFHSNPYHHHHHHHNHHHPHNIINSMSFLEFCIICDNSVAAQQVASSAFLRHLNNQPNYSPHSQITAVSPRVGNIGPYIPSLNLNTNQSYNFPPPHHGTHPTAAYSPSRRRFSAPPSGPPANSSSAYSPSHAMLQHQHSSSSSNSTASLYNSVNSNSVTTPKAGSITGSSSVTSATTARPLFGSPNGTNQSNLLSAYYYDPNAGDGSAPNTSRYDGMMNLHHSNSIAGMPLPPDHVRNLSDEIALMQHLQSSANAMGLGPPMYPLSLASYSNSSIQFGEKGNDRGERGIGIGYMGLERTISSSSSLSTPAISRSESLEIAFSHYRQQQQQSLSLSVSGATPGYGLGVGELNNMPSLIIGSQQNSYSSTPTPSSAPGSAYDLLALVNQPNTNLAGASGASGTLGTYSALASRNPVIAKRNPNIERMISEASSKVNGTSSPITSPSLNVAPNATSPANGAAGGLSASNSVGDGIASMMNPISPIPIAPYHYPSGVHGHGIPASPSPPLPQLHSATNGGTSSGPNPVTLSPSNGTKAPLKINHSSPMTTSNNSSNTAANNANLMKKAQSPRPSASLFPPPIHTNSSVHIGNGHGNGGGLGQAPSSSATNVERLTSEELLNQKKEIARRMRDFILEKYR